MNNYSNFAYFVNWYDSPIDFICNIPYYITRVEYYKFLRVKEFPQWQQKIILMYIVPPG
jgi:hypothetical protein